MNDNQRKKQVSLAGAAAGNREAKSTRKKKRIHPIVILAVLVAVVLLLVLLLRGKGESGPSLTARETVQYTITPDNIAGKVSYFALGVLGEESTDRMDMTAVMCYDRKADKITVMQMPVATYLGETDDFAATVLGDVWGNPKALTWCDTCRCQVSADEVDDDEHVTCGSKLTSRVGSSFVDYAAVFNKQYGLPIDNYLVIPRDGLVKLIDAVGGVDMQLEATITVDGISYNKGVQTLPGAAAVYYVTEYNYSGRPDADRARMLRQRQLFAGLLERLSGYKENELYNAEVDDVLSGVMLGADPIRYDTTSFGKARLMNVSENRAENVKYIAALAAFIYDIGRVDMEDITYCTLPGVAVKRGTGYVYSVNKAQTIALLEEYMNPYGLTLDDTTVNLTELKTNPADVDTAVTTLDQVLVTVSTEQE